LLQFSGKLRAGLGDEVWRTFMQASRDLERGHSFEGERDPVPIAGQGAEFRHAERVEVDSVRGHQGVVVPTCQAELGRPQSVSVAEGPGKGFQAPVTGSNGDRGDAVQRVLKLPGGPLQPKPPDVAKTVFARYPAEDTLKVIRREVAPLGHAGDVG